VVNFRFFYRLQTVPEIQNHCYSDSNSGADEEEPAVSGPRDKNKHHGCNGQDESADAFKVAHSFLEPIAAATANRTIVAEDGVTESLTGGPLVPRLEAATE
jgi:hypothetical protein